VSWSSDTASAHVGSAHARYERAAFGSRSLPPISRFEHLGGQRAERG
jgi:hypothetical protein